MREQIGRIAFRTERQLDGTTVRGANGGMRSLRLTVSRTDLLRALQTLSTNRRKRFSSTLPVWLRFDATERSLQIMEDRGSVGATIEAQGSWPPAGITVDLFMLKRLLGKLDQNSVELHAAADGVMVIADRWHVKLNLLRFGPDNTVPGASSDRPPPPILPLFRWSEHKK